MPQSLIDLSGLRVGSEEFLSAVLAATEQPIWVVDHDGVIRFANPAAIAGLGYDRMEELLGRHSHETIHHSRPDGTPLPVADCSMLLPRVTGETVSRDRDWFFRRDGSMFPVSYVSAPIEMHDGRGAVVAFTDIEDRLREEEVVRERQAALAAQQGSLRRVAALVAGGATSGEVLAAIAREVGEVIGLPLVVVWRYEPDGRTATVVGAWSDHSHPFRTGSRWPLDGPTITAQVLKTGRPARIDDWADVPGTIADAARGAGITAAAGAPIVVDGDTWGAMSTDLTDGAPMPADVEDRLLEFTELIGAVFATTARQDELARLADEQAALRRVATLVAQDVPASELFGAVVEEVGRLFRSDLAGMIHYETDGSVSATATWAAEGEHPTVDGRWSLEGDRLATAIARTSRPAREDNWGEVEGPIAEFVRSRLGVVSSVGSPIVVEGRVWGALFVHSRAKAPPLPAGTESRLMDFTELIATAMSNAQARAEVERLAAEQAALRRVATLVAEGASPASVFDAVAGQMEALLDADQVALNRFEPDGAILVLAHRGLDVERTPVGSRVKTEGESATATVLRTGQPARMEGYDEADGALGELARATGLRCSVSAPIIVDGYLWGVITASWKGGSPPPPDTEQRMARFAQLLDTAIANAEARAELMASRARLVAASDEARRRFERDLHDGVQQRLVSLSFDLRAAEAIAPPEHEELASQLAHAADGLAEALDDLRELSRGIHPAVLSEGGLVPALKALARRSAVPVRLELDLEGRLPDRVEVAAYYVVSEALTNAAKHSQASVLRVRGRVHGHRLELCVDDDGVGGADPEQGSGLTGLADRVEALGGSIAIASTPGEGTSLRVVLSLESQ